MNLLWTDSKLLQLPKDLRAALKFYAPLTENLYFWGIDPVTFTRAGASTAIWRDGASHAVAANIPRFEFSSDLPSGIKLSTGETLQFSAQNGLDDSNTLIWFEDGVPMSTPTNSNPFNASAAWVGNLDVHIKHIIKATRVLANAEITQIQKVLADIAQSLPEPPSPPVSGAGAFFEETPSGARNGTNTVFTLSVDPNLDSLEIVCHGGLSLKRVASSPAELQYTAGGTGNRTITMGLAPNATDDFTARGVTA